jgi:uncharacterized protein YcfL
MKPAWIIAAALAALAAGCAAPQKGFEVPGQAFGCPIGDAKVSSMEDLVKAKVVMEGSRTTVMPTELRCSRSGDLLRIDANLNNDSKSVKRISYKFRWIDREGMRAWEEEPWKPLLLNDNSNYLLNTVAPTGKAADFRLILRSQE